MISSRKDIGFILSHLLFPFLLLRDVSSLFIYIIRDDSSLVKRFGGLSSHLLKCELSSLKIILGDDTVNNLRLVRKADSRKLTQQDVADWLGIDRSTYGKYEQGSSEPTFDTLHKLADFFGVSMEYLMGLPELKKASTPEEVNALPEAQALREVMETLSPEDRQRVLEFGRNLAATSHTPKQQK